MIVRYSAILAAGFEPQLIVSGERASLRLPALAGNSPALRLTAEFTVTGFLRLLRQYVGPATWPGRACFSYPAPAYAAEYRKVFAGIERFDQAFNGLEFPRAWLAQKQLFGNAELSNLLQSHAERELARLARGATVSERVQSLLAAHNPSELPSLIEAARELQMSARTLSRKLRAEATNYADLVEHRRASAAKSLLERNHSSIQETAYAMGFGDAQSFHRAFKRWTGLTPTQYLASV
jgi:AraC-like DNA-binding protein